MVANRMIQYALEQAKEPVWACHYQNIASERMAEKLGFIKVSECSVIKRRSSVTALGLGKTMERKLQ